MNNNHKKIIQLAVFLMLFNLVFSAEDVFAQKTKKTVSSLNTVKRKDKKAVFVLSVAPVVEDIASKVKRIAYEEKLDLRLFQALISQESNGRMNAVSNKGAACMTQLMPATARRLGLAVNGTVDERYNPDKCLRAGARYLRFLLDTFKDVRLALAGYNAGEGAVIRFGNRIPPYKETIQYVEKISYRYFGQVGHGTAFAWNMPLAVKYSQAAHGNRVNFGLIRQTNQSTPVRRRMVDITALPVPAEIASSEQTGVDKDNVKEIVKPTRVTFETKPGRVPAASLFFFPKSNQK